jgi:DNA-binding MarR family transcriptional regulator
MVERSVTQPQQQDTEAWQRSRCVSTSVRRVDRALNRIYDDALRPSGLVTTQYALLAMLARAAGPVPHHRLASAQEMASTTLSRNLKPLARDGLVRIEPGQDRRKRYVFITPEGQAALERARPLWRSVQDRVIAEVGDDRVDRLLGELTDLLERVRTP